MTCPECEETGHIVETRQTDKFFYGEGLDAPELFAEVIVMVCTACGFRCTDDRANEPRAKAVLQLHLQRAEAAVSVMYKKLAEANEGDTRLKSVSIGLIGTVTAKQFEILKESSEEIRQHLERAEITLRDFTEDIWKSWADDKET